MVLYSEDAAAQAEQSARKLLVEQTLSKATEGARLLSEIDKLKARRLAYSQVQSISLMGPPENTTKKPMAVIGTGNEAQVERIVLKPIGVGTTVERGQPRKLYASDQEFMDRQNSVPAMLVAQLIVGLLQQMDDEIEAFEQELVDLLGPPETDE